MLCLRDLGASFSSLWWGAPFSRFGCFVLRSSFSSASFSKLPLALKHFTSIGSIAVLKSGVCSFLIVAFSGGMGLFPNLQLLNEAS